MKNLQFKTWLEFADYGFDNDQYNKPRGGTETLTGNVVHSTPDTALIISELSKMPALGPNEPRRTWNNIVEWGAGPGAMQIAVSPLGMLKIIARRCVTDLLGEQTWVCKAVFPISDNRDENREQALAVEMHDKLIEISNTELDGPSTEFDIDKLAWRLWSATKRNHPSYCMFPTGFRKQHENYYKLVFEFRGHGVERLGNPRGGRAEQFDIDLLYDKKRGIIKCWGYNIDSTLGQHSWKVQPSEWNEWFCPNQEIEDICDCIIKIFMKY